MVKFVRNVPPLIQLEQTVENPTFSPALSLITELDQPSSDFEDVQDDVDAHLLRQHELDREEQNAQDVESFNEYMLGSGYNGLFWHDIEP